jgi:hypothetical protein
MASHRKIVCTAAEEGALPAAAALSVSRGTAGKVFELAAIIGEPMSGLGPPIR